MDDTTRVDIAEEARLVRRARWGSREAFETLYSRHAGAIHALALRLTGNPATAEDVTQETFLQLLRFMDAMAPDRPLRPWLKRVAANAAIDRLRRERRMVEFDDAIAADSAAEEAGQPDDGSLGLLQRFPPEVRTVVWLRVVEGWTHRELAGRFGHSESWSKSLVSRALARMREMIEVEDDGRA
ncbi:RNA polymerase sigma factor [Luteimonas dalianensis]|uniref:RNA polymerase sigma factor n=1 Tax=Luteimonas dalianensis TaxID=1148196 RepID=UPI003BEF571F